MGLQTPRLDDRTFNDIVEEARQRIALYAPEWTDHNLSDPGITLIELFAWMTDIVLYRLNRVPDKHFIKFMELIGMHLHEAQPARVPVTFWLTAPQPTTIVIPGDTEVSTTRTETEPAIIFSTDGPLEIHIPKLIELSTGFLSTEGAYQYTSHNVGNAESGYEGFLIFASETPQSDDALYLGFEQDLSNHILGIDLEVGTAEGAGIDPNNPPYVWEVLGTEIGQTWSRIDIDIDQTRGLNVSGLIRLHLPNMRRATRNDVTGYWIRCRLNYTDDINEVKYDVSPQIQRLQTSSWGGTVGATNVTRVRNEVIGRSDGSPGQRFYLEHVPIVARTSEEFILVRLQDGRDENWQEVTDFSTSKTNDKHYTIDSDTGEVRLGPALPQPDGHVHRYGAIPPQGAALVMTGYRHGGGQVGNVAAHTLNVLKTALPYIDRVRNRIPAQGGLDRESLENAKTRVPGYLRSIGRAVTASDFEYLAYEAAPGQVGRVHCLQPPQTNRGEIKVLVIPNIPHLRGFISPESLHLPEDVQTDIQTYLDDRRLLSTQMEVIPPAYQWVETEIRLRVSQHYNAEKVQEAVEDRLFDFLNPLTGGPDKTGWPFGRDLFVSDIMAVLLSVPGVNFIRSVTLYPINYEDGQFIRGAAAQEVPLVSHGVVVSYQHVIISE